MCLRIFCLTWTRRGVVVVKKGVYRGFEFVDTAMYTAPDLLLGEQCEEAFDLVQHELLVGVR